MKICWFPLSRQETYDEYMRNIRRCPVSRQATTVATRAMLRETLSPTQSPSRSCVSVVIMMMMMMMMIIFMMTMNLTQSPSHPHNHVYVSHPVVTIADIFLSFLHITNFLEKNTHLSLLNLLHLADYLIQQIRCAGVRR